jgi:serine/threonine-protein kinase
MRRLPNSIGRYVVERELGKGAMGRVLLCRDPVLERLVAVKHLRADLAIATEHRQPLLDRMRQEARASARVSHPNLVALHDMGEDREVGLYLVFEYVEGPTLKERLRQGPMANAKAASLARELGAGMRFAHDAGVLHRDIKPENVILSKTGAKLADFGIARIPDSTLTQGGSILGTPAYSAPEALGDGKFSPRSDQFSLAATLYEAVSGRRAFPGDDAVSVARLITTSEAPPIALVCQLSPGVDAVLQRALSKVPMERFNDCEQFGNALAETLAPEARRSQVTLPDSYHAPSRSHASVSLVVSAALLGAVGTWLGTRMLFPESAPAQSSVVLAVPDESPDAPWLKTARKPSELQEKGSLREVERPASSKVKPPSQPPGGPPPRKTEPAPKKGETPSADVPSPEGTLGVRSRLMDRASSVPDSEVSGAGVGTPAEPR